MPATWNIDVAEPMLPAAREQALYDALGCGTSFESRHVASMQAYAVIRQAWGRTFPVEPNLDALPVVLAGAESTAWPDSAPAPFGTPTHGAPSRRPDAARAPTAALRFSSIGRVTG